MTEKLRVDLPILLPDVADAADGCVPRLVESLKAREGVIDAHLRPAEDDQPAQVCVHYESGTLSLDRIRKLVQAAGVEISGRYGHAVWQVDGIPHARRARTVAERLRTLEGVVEADASAAGTVRVEFDRQRIDEPRILDALAGMQVAPVKPTAVAASDPDERTTAAQAHDGIHADGGQADGGQADSPGGKHGHATGGKHGHGDHGTHAHGKDAHGHAHGGLLGP